MRFDFIALTLLLAQVSTTATAQGPVHEGDIQIGYDNLASPTELVLVVTSETADGIPIFPDAFGQPDPFSPGDFSTTDPGFSTDPSIDLQFNEGDQLFLTALNAFGNSLTGVGYVNYYNPADDQLQASGQLEISDRSAATEDLILDGASITSGASTQFVQQAAKTSSTNVGADVHRHLTIDLLNDATSPVGAYGVLFELQSDFGTADGTPDLTSEPFWIIWNYGLSTSDFQDNALPQFIGSLSETELGDFNLDGSVDLDDLDQYIGNIGADALGDLAALDLDNDGTVGANDFQRHYEQLVETSNGGKGTFAGDLDLNGVVDVLGDAAILVQNLGATVNSLSLGDANGDGIVDVLGDAALLVENLGQSNSGAGLALSTSAVPEPSSTSLLALGMSFLLSLRRRD